MLENISEMNKKTARMRGSLYISVADAAKKNKVSTSRIRKLISEGRVAGAYKIGDLWAIPSTWSMKKERKKRTPKPEPHMIIDRGVVIK